MGSLSTSFRMYNAGPRAAAAWNRLFERVFGDLALDIRILEHGWPDPIGELWSRPDLCCAFMCGWPFVTSQAGMQAIAVPVPSPPRYGGSPRYCSEFLVRAQDGWTSLADTFGARFGWMAADSQSGFNAPRYELSRHMDASRTALYRELVGPLGTPARVLQALREERVDVVAVDCFYLDLCRRHQPDVLEGLRCVATTPWTPIPLLVAAPSVSLQVVDRLRACLTALHERPEGTELLADVLLARFAVPELDAYQTLELMARVAQD